MAASTHLAQAPSPMRIAVTVSGVGLLEFHQIDSAREAGRDAALAALQNAPSWLFDSGHASSSLAGRRTVIRV